MSRIVRYGFYLLVWTLIALYVLWAHSQAEQSRKSLKIKEWKIELTDSTAQGQLVSTSEVYRWLNRAGLAKPGTPADSVDLLAVEQVIARNGFVERASASITSEGVLQIKIRQREPVLRLLTEGHNAYVTLSGLVFATPEASSLNVPVVTGDYRTPFPKGYTGVARHCIDEGLAAIDREIEDIEQKRLTVIRAERAGLRQLRDSLRTSISSWYKWGNKSVYQEMVERLKEKKRAWRRLHLYRSRMRNMELDRLESLREQAKQRQKNLEKNYEDFMKLLTFVKQLEQDRFWGAEVVQIVAHTAPGGALEVDLVPRSGGHLIRFGRLEREQEKFDLLRRFYRHGLSQVGWDRYQTIDVRYNGQVVCR